MSELGAARKPQIGIAGLGLIGGSIGLALRDPSRTILGCDISAKAQEMALARQCVDEIAPLTVVSQCDVVFIGAPPGAVIEVAEAIYETKAKETVVTDCSSVKSEISSWAEKGRDLFVPGHPMAGHEKSGCEYSSAWLFRSARWILTPNKKTNRSAVSSVEALVKEMGASPVRLDPSDHDRHVGVLSHLPHVIATALVLEAEKLEHLEVGAGSWKDLTRVGGVDPALWTQILSENRSELTQILGDFQIGLERIRKLLAEDDRRSLEAILTDAKNAKARQMQHSQAKTPASSGTLKRRR